MEICEYVYPFASSWMVIDSLSKMRSCLNLTARCTALNGYAPRPVLEILHTAGSSGTLPASEAPSIQIRMSQAQQNAVKKDEIPCPAFVLPKSSRNLQASKS